MNRNSNMIFAFILTLLLLTTGCSSGTEFANSIINTVEPVLTDTPPPATANQTTTIQPVTLTPGATITASPSPTITETQTITDFSLDVSQVIASGFNRPVAITHAGDGTNRLFVVEQGGLIRIVKDGVLLDQPFLDLTGMLSQRSEQGLLGLAFHPDYQDNGFFYVDYTDLQGNTQIARYQVSDNPDQANASSAKNLLSVSQPYANHNGGQIAFGHDGYLYIGLGDGGSADDPQNNAQNLSSPFGTILRIEMKDDGSYTIPTSNPFFQQENADARIWAWGLRNPWRFSFDRQTGDLYIADVGQNQWEEIDFQPADSRGGLNYGWRCFEATHPYISQSPCNDPNYVNQFIGPIAEYNHQMGQSITGGYVYRGSAYPYLNGFYFYADFASGRIWSIQLLDRQSQTWSEPKLELESGINISSFGEDENGEIYLADYYGGTIRLLTAAPK